MQLITFDDESSEKKILLFYKLVNTAEWSRKQAFIETLMYCINDNIANVEFGVRDIAQSLHLSISQLNRKLKILTGTSAGQTLTEIRLNYAAGLLAEDVGNVNEVAYRSGFRDPAYFCRRFKRQFDCTPSEFRQSPNFPYGRQVKQWLHKPATAAGSRKVLFNREFPGIKTAAFGHRPHG